MNNTITTISTIISDFKTEGFVHTFSVIADEIGCSGPRKLYKPAEIKIVKQDKFDANPYSSAGAIIYALETYDGYRGVLVHRLGTFADEAIGKFIQQTSTYIA
ncbi:MAG: hypothetical protein ABIN94_10600 [Ferruginibacter sp.]